MKALLLVTMVLSALTLGGCQNDNTVFALPYWLSGPRTAPEELKKQFDDDIKLGSLRADVEKVLGKPTDFIYQTDSNGKTPEDSRAGWMLYKYDYPATPMLVTVRLDQFGIVVDKHYDDKDTVAKLAAQKSAKEKEAEGYEGGPQKRFQDLIKKHEAGGESSFSRSPMTPSGDLAPVVANFALDGTFLDAAPYGSGHINDTFALRLRQSDGAQRRYILQRINTAIFTEPAKLMENVVRVTGHLRAKLAAAGADAQRRALRLLPTRTGGAYHTDPTGHVWRVYDFIDGASTYDLIASPPQALQAGRAFGEFQKLAADLPPPRLHETLPGFHDTPRRYARFQEVLASDVAGRAAGARAEIEVALSWQDRAALLVDAQRQGRLPERITHNDTKCNNVLIDDATGAGLCVIDLDTVMPGLAVNDFGEAIRTGAATAAEDERDLSRVGLRLDLFEAYARGYLDAAGDLLTPAEIDHLVLAAQMMTYENGLRFLADHLAGDVYYRIHRPGHNLDRCRTQWAMLREMQRRTDEMEQIVRRYR